MKTKKKNSPTSIQIRNILVYFIFLCALCATVASARTYSVPSVGMKTISDAIIQSRSGDTIFVSNGVYKEKIMLTNGIALISRNRFGAVIDGQGRGTVVTMGKGTTISGFEIRNGTIGIFTSNPGNAIISCRITGNWQTGIITVRHLPRIEDNVIAFNRSSGIQGWNVRSTNASINHNTIAYNGNHGIALGGNSNLVIENNVLAFNERYALKILDSKDKIQVVSNNLYNNLRQPGGLPDKNYSFDPAFINPRVKKDFSSDPTQCCKVKGSDNKNLGSRTVY